MTRFDWIAMLVAAFALAIIIWAVSATGCAAKGEATLQAQLQDLTAQVAAIASKTTGAGTASAQTAGRDTINISPELVLSGGGAVLVLMLIIVSVFIVIVRRRGRMLNAVIDGVELANQDYAKAQIRTVATAAGVEPALNRRVKRRTGNTNVGGNST